jgi:hypothetical protein
MSIGKLEFEDLILPASLTALPRKRENALRTFHVDGRAVKISRDLIEATYAYEFRASFALARSFNPGERVEELVASSRVALNKRWSPLERDVDSGALESTPHYPDTVEARYARARHLPAMDAAVERVPSRAAETLYYEPEEVQTTGEARTSAEEVEALEQPEAGEVEDLEPPEEVQQRTSVHKQEEGRYELSVDVPLRQGKAGVVSRGQPIVERVTDAHKRAILRPVFEAYSSRLASDLQGRSGPAKIDIELVGVEQPQVAEAVLTFRIPFSSRKLAKEAAARIRELVRSLPPVKLGSGATGSVVTFLA